MAAKKRKLSWPVMGACGLFQRTTIEVSSTWSTVGSGGASGANKEKKEEMRKTDRKYYYRSVGKDSFHTTWYTCTCCLWSRQDQTLLSFFRDLIDIYNVLSARKQVGDIHRSGCAWKIFEIKRRVYWLVHINTSNDSATYEKYIKKIYVHERREKTRKNVLMDTQSLSMHNGIIFFFFFFSFFSFFSKDG